MNRIDAKFAALRQNKKKAFIPFLTCGDPDLESTEQMALAFEQAGADILELGVPFSDPMADGPTIQAASQRALKNKVSLKNIIDLVRRLRTVTQMPLVLMTYYNPVFRYGTTKFVVDAKAAGVDGVIIPDLPPEEAEDLIKAARTVDLATIFLVAPTTLPARMAMIVKASTGFVYYVSLTGVTGARSTLPPGLKENVRKIKAISDKPVCVGFGISTAQQMSEVATVADGVIVASAIIKEIEKYIGTKEMLPRVSTFVKSLAGAV